MNDEENKPQPWIDPALEARIVAHILGETSAFEAAELERLLAENPELAIFKRRIEAVHALLGSAVRPENPKIQLSPERRRKLLETIGVPVASPQKVRVVGLPRVAWWLSPILIRVAACLIMTTLVLVIFSSIHVYRNAGEPPSFEGESGGFASASFTVSVDDTKAGRAASPLAADEKALGATLSAGGPVALGAKPQMSSAYDLSSNNTYSGGTLAGTGVVPTTQSYTRQEVAKIEKSIAASETEYGRQPSAEASALVTAPGPGFEVSRKAGDGTIALQNNVPAPAAAPQAETLSSANQLTVETAEKEIAGESQNLVMAQQQIASVDEESQTEGRDGTPLPSVDGALDKSKTTIVSEYLNGAPDSDLVAKANPNAGWDSLYMYRGVNILAAPGSETKPLPAEVADQIAKSLPDDQEAVTTGERSASGATSANSVDALLFGVSAEATQDTNRKSTANTQTSTTGGETAGDHLRVAQTDKDAAPVLGDVPLAGRLFREEAGKDKLSDLVSSPVVTIRSGQHASTRVAREFEYPSEFQPHSTPTAVETASPKESTQNVINQPIFSTREGGKVEFDGFINYGSPITTIPTEGQKVERQEYLIKEGEEFSGSGRYDLAFKRYQQALEINPHNIAARRGMETVNETRAKYAATASNEAFRNGVQSVDKSWELPVRKFDIGATTIVTQPQLGKRGTSAITKKLNEIVIPRVDLQDVTVGEALEFLKQRSVDLDSTEKDPARKGINIVQADPSEKDAQTKITLSLSNISVLEALRYVTELSGKKYKVEPYTVSIVPLSESTQELVTKEYKVPPGFIPAPPASGSPLPKMAGATTAAGSLPAVAARSGARNYLETSGVTFPPGATAYFIASSNKLIVKNTPSNLELVDTLVEAQIGRDGSPSRPSTAGSENPPYQPPNEIATAKQPVSTFSLHVSDVSFQLAKDALAKGAMPDPARIRPEEFYNAFDYNDPAPGPGEEVACRIEQCAHPFLQQRNLVRIAVKAAAAGRAAGQPLRLTILLDTSGSMEREDRAVSVRRALQTLTTLLGPNDRVTLIGFARTPRLLAEQVPGDQAGKLVETADHTPSEGGTNLEEALALASEMALKQKLPAAQNRIVLLTDGAANLGNADPVRLARQIEKTRQQGISFDACGVGANGLNDEMLEALTRRGDGRYYFLNKPGDADAGFARQLAGAFHPAAENVKVQVVFNPARVSQYRLIGFEKHLLKKEDFRNDKVQAAELSAEEAGVALYQVEALPEGDGELGEVFVRFRDPATGQMVERSWTMPYEAQARSFDQASPSMQLAATAALLAEKLRGNPQVDLDALKPVVNNLRSHYPHQARVRELLQMFDQLKQ